MCVCVCVFNLSALQRRACWKRRLDRTADWFTYQHHYYILLFINSYARFELKIFADVRSKIFVHASRCIDNGRLEIDGIRFSWISWSKQKIKKRRIQKKKTIYKMASRVVDIFVAKFIIQFYGHYSAAIDIYVYSLTAVVLMYWCQCAFKHVLVTVCLCYFSDFSV